MLQVVLMEFSPTTHSLINSFNNIWSKQKLHLCAKNVACFQSYVWFVMKTPSIFIVAHVKICEDKNSSWWIISNLSYLRFDNVWGCNASCLSYLIFLLQNVSEPGGQKNHDLCIGYDFLGRYQFVQLWWWWWKNT